MNVNNDDKLIKYQFGVHDKQKKQVSTKANDDLGKDAFLHLLTTQLANQDPLDPMDDREFIAQLAQFSSLEQMNNLNDKALDMIDAIDYLNLNEIQANVSLLKEITKIKKGLEEYLGISFDDLVGDEEIKPEDIEKPEETEKPEANEKPGEENNSNPGGTTDINSKMMAYRLRK